ncbi:MULTISPECIES: hypothetical protein [unclassified Luteimonas]|uniref:hypothetical protein n=1 Tax=unclassified Luteimonas TaxID=2629088 RepID=UPI0018F06E98|nr:MULTISPECIES: hypothetical protein [unclassified Luteimonas]MBJ6980157.1 hypothetical protein [Luteimonas sp. MC1895]MBJ6985364.1 hypothetical protein [Luteimonas sp. MC1750]QQO05375.1 hypothetical protein JGR68_11100 [Luteimonas sp. MC1750]
MPVRRLLLAALLVAAAPALAQQQPIESRMTPEEFKATGLDQLDAAQLARLNAWLGRTIEGETEKAAATAKRKVEDENRGFLSFGSSEPVTGRIAGTFSGFARGREYTLDNGQVWRQIDGASLAGVRREAPTVRITPSLVGNAWYMAVEGSNTRAKVERVK